MNREQAIVVLKILKTAYPRFYSNMSKEDAEDTINLWIDMFKDDNPQVVIVAVRKMINELQFPPTIADVKNAIYELTYKQEDSTELWDKFMQAVKRSGYEYIEEYAKLPEKVKKFVGTAERLRDFALMDLDTLDTVVKGQFLRQMESLKKSEKEFAMLPNEAKEIISKLAQGKDIKAIGGVEND